MRFKIPFGRFEDIDNISGGIVVTTTKMFHFSELFGLGLFNSKSEMELINKIVLMFVLSKMYCSKSTYLTFTLIVHLGIVLALGSNNTSSILI